jgi:hypothetical protein
MKIDPANYVRPGTAAKIAGVTRAFVILLCRQGKLGFFRVCNSWFVSVPDCEEYRRKTPGKVPPYPKLTPPRKQAPVDPTLYVTMGTAAGLAECARQTMNREVNGGRVPAVWIDGQWIILRSAAKALEIRPSQRARIHPVPPVIETPADQRNPRKASVQQTKRRTKQPA